MKCETIDINFAGKNFRDYVHVSDVPVVERHFQEGKISEFEIRFDSNSPNSFQKIKHLEWIDSLEQRTHNLRRIEDHANDFLMKRTALLLRGKHERSLAHLSIIYNVSSRETCLTNELISHCGCFLSLSLQWSTQVKRKALSTGFVCTMTFMHLSILEVNYSPIHWRINPTQYSQHIPSFGRRWWFHRFDFFVFVQSHWTQLWLEWHCLHAADEIDHLLESGSSAKQATDATKSGGEYVANGADRHPVCVDHAGNAQECLEFPATTRVEYTGHSDPSTELVLSSNPV